MLSTRDTRYVLHSMPFSTYDQNNALGSDCCSLFGCGWWMNECYAAYLNGRWKDTSWHEPWTSTVTSAENISSTVMMIRPNKKKWKKKTLSYKGIRNLIKFNLFWVFLI